MADIATKRLKLIESPLLDPNDTGETLDPSPPQRDIDSDASDFRRLLHRLNPPKDAPRLKTYNEATTLELFYDLFFAANYSIFSQTQSIKDGESFKAYLGYFCTLWITWFMVTTYDVRFVADSVFERCARAVQIGVMVGFTVVSPRFDPGEQDVPTMRRLSAILSISRIVLAAEYGTIIWHTRKCRMSRFPLYLQVAVNLCSAFVYVGTLFFFDDKHKTDAFVMWYVTGGLEMAATMLLSNLWHILSFADTHLMKRMSLLTIIILGDAIVALAQDVVLIVKAPKAWRADIIGIVTAASTTIYLVFLCYFDWMKHTHLPSWRQQIWTTLHFPLHVSMVLFTQCIAQFVIWAKITETLGGFVFDPRPLFGKNLTNATSESFRDGLVNITDKIFRDYPVVNYEASQMLFLAYQNITEIPDNFWPNLSLWMNDPDYFFENANDTAHFETVMGTLDDIFSTMVNGIFVKFKVDVYGDVMKAQSNLTSKNSLTQIMNTMNDASIERYFTIFSYGYTSAGLTLLIMTFLTIVSRLTPWRPWPLMRAIVNILLGIGLCFVSLLRHSPEKEVEYVIAPYKQAKYLLSPWLVPAICLVWIVVVIMTHTHSEAAILHPEAPERMLKSARAWFRSKFGMDKTYSNIEMTEQQTAYNGSGPS